MRRRIVTCLSKIALRSTSEGQCKDHAKSVIQRTLFAVSQSETSLTGFQSSWSSFAALKQLGPQRGSRLQSTEATWNSVLYPDSEMEIGCPAPDFEAPAVINGEIKDIRLSDYKGKYVLLFFYPKDFTFVCPTEIIAFSDRAKEFADLNCEVIAASTDTAEVHLAWIKTPRKRGGLGFMQIPILADVTKEISARFGVLKKDAGVALRGLYIINPEGIVEHATINNLGVGRSVDEALRTLQAVQYVAEHGEVCPAGWKPGDKAMIADPEKSLEYFESAPASQDEETSNQSALHAIDSRKEFESIIQGKKVAVKFWAEWCGKCKLLAPHAEELALKYPDIKVVSVQTTDEKLEGLVSDLGVKGLPAFRFYSDGKEVLKPIVGYKKQPLAETFGELDKM